MKRAFTFILPLLLLIGFASAATFSLGDVLDNIDEATLIVVFVFVVSFALIFFSLNKLFKGNTAIAAVISFATSLLLTYWVNKAGFNIRKWFSNIGLSEETLFILIPVLVIAAIILLVLKFKRDSLILIGLGLIASAFVVEEQVIVIAVGAALVVIRFFLKKKDKDPLVRTFKKLADKLKKHN